MNETTETTHLATTSGPEQNPPSPLSQGGTEHIEKATHATTEHAGPHIPNSK